MCKILNIDYKDNPNVTHNPNQTSSVTQLVTQTTEIGLLYCF